MCNLNCVRIVRSAEVCCMTCVCVYMMFVFTPTTIPIMLSITQIIAYIMDICHLLQYAFLLIALLTVRIIIPTKHNHTHAY